MKTIIKIAVFTVIVMVFLFACTPLYKKAQAAEPTPTATPTPTPTPTITQININTATLDELKTLPGIKEKLAQAIIAGRPYQTLDAVLNVKGIGYSKLEKIRAPIMVEEAKPDATPTPKATTTPTPKSNN